jgi:glycerophosphoryl diester phosphodiesterase
LGVWAFAVEDEERLEELIDMGVTAVTTNRPERTLGVAGSRSPAATKERDQ